MNALSQLARGLKSCYSALSPVSRVYLRPKRSPFQHAAAATPSWGSSQLWSPLSWPFLQQLVRFRSNRSRRGLYDGRDVRFGNRISHSMRKTRRKFKPNVQLKRLYSETLDEMIRFHVTTSALRSIDRAGGLDNYLLTSKHVTHGEGLKAKKRILQRFRFREKQKRWAEEKKANEEVAHNLLSTSSDAA